MGVQTDESEGEEETLEKGVPVECSTQDFTEVSCVASDINSGETLGQCRNFTWVNHSIDINATERVPKLECETDTEKVVDNDSDNKLAREQCDLDPNTEYERKIENVGTASKCQDFTGSIDINAVTPDSLPSTSKENPNIETEKSDEDVPNVDVDVESVDSV